MDQDRVSANYYRKHAAELREIASTMNDPNSKKILLRVADDYECMAQSRDRLDETDLKIKR